METLPGAEGVEEPTGGAVQTRVLGGRAWDRGGRADAQRPRSRCPPPAEGRMGRTRERLRKQEQVDGRKRAKTTENRKQLCGAFSHGLLAVPAVIKTPWSVDMGELSRRLVLPVSLTYLVTSHQDTRRRPLPLPPPKLAKP